MDAQEKEIATKTDKDTAAEAVATEATGGTPELPDVADYIKPEVAEQLRRQLTNAKLSPQKGLIYLASFPKSGNTWTRLFLFALFNPMVRDDSNFNLSDIAGRAGQMDVTFQLFERILGKPHYEISDQEVAQTSRWRVPLAIQQDVHVFVKTHCATAPGRHPDHRPRYLPLSRLHRAQPARRNPVFRQPHEHRHRRLDSGHGTPIALHRQWQKKFNRAEALKA